MQVSGDLQHLQEAILDLDFGQRGPELVDAEDLVVRRHDIFLEVRVADVLEGIGHGHQLVVDVFVVGQDISEDRLGDDDMLLRGVNVQPLTDATGLAQAGDAHRVPALMRNASRAARRMRI